MTDQYAKGCEIEPILPQSVSPMTESFANSVIHQMSIMCIDHITEQLSKSYTEKYNIFMVGRDRDSLRQHAARKYLEYLAAEGEAVKTRYLIGNSNDPASKTVG